jgi:menin
VAFAVVAGCQTLGYADVHLALSEDHAWVVFGERGTETAEVTWHGKGNEDKRGQEIGKGVSARSWLYVNNKPVICTRHMEVAALVSAINPSLNATHDAFEVALLQQELLWLLYDLGHLKKYPMAIGNLGDLEEIAPKEGRTACSVLFEEAISSARTYYNNQHVYPYTYQGGYFYRNKMYKEAFESWANASDVIRLYNYSRDDEEIYKEFLEIANELIPHIMKVESSGFSANTILKKPECFANLLRFYDGICQWEEGSATPVLHIGWAKPLVNTISKFDSEVRAQVDIVCGKPEDDTNKRANGGYFNNNNYEKENGTNESALLSSIGSRPLREDQSTSNFHPSIEALTAACSEKILNPDYLLQGDGSPFVGGDDAITLEKENGKPSTSKQEIE